jgi:hypothetical protein
MHSELFEIIIRTCGTHTDDLYDEESAPLPELSETVISLFERVLRKTSALPNLSKEIKINDDEKKVLDAYNDAKGNPVDRQASMEAIKNYYLNYCKVFMYNGGYQNRIIKNDQLLPCKKAVVKAEILDSMRQIRNPHIKTKPVQ